MSNLSSIRCPICNSRKYEYEAYYDYGGIIEEHAYCDRCGYFKSWAYSPIVAGFLPIIHHGYVDSCGIRHNKNSRKRKRMKRKFHCNYSNCEYLKYL